MPEPIRIEIGRKVAHIYGKGGTDACVRSGIPSMRCAYCKARIIPADRGPDLATFLELRERPVVVEAVLV